MGRSSSGSAYGCAERAGDMARSSYSVGAADFEISKVPNRRVVAMIGVLLVVWLGAVLLDLRIKRKWGACDG